MIELPPDLAEVLKIVQSNEHGAGITWPNGDEDALAELSEAWKTWNSAAAAHTRTILTGVAQARQNMSGDAADQYEEYLRKYAIREDSHVGTTLDAGLAVEDSLQGASHAVTQTKTEMTRELKYAKDYIATHPAGKHDDVARSEGVKQAADTYHSYIDEASGSIDSMLRQSSTHLDRMDGAGQAATLRHAAGAPSGTAPTSATLPDGTVVPADLRSPGAVDGADSPMTAPLSQADPSAPGAFDPDAPDQGAAGSDGAGAYGANVPGAASWNGGQDGAGSTVDGLQPFSLPTGADGSSALGGAGGIGGSGGGVGGGAHVFDTSSGSQGLHLAGLGDLGTGGGGYAGSGSPTGGSGLTPWSPQGGGGSAGLPFDLAGPSSGGSLGGYPGGSLTGTSGGYGTTASRLPSGSRLGSSPFGSSAAGRGLTARGGGFGGSAAGRAGRLGGGAAFGGSGRAAGLGSATGEAALGSRRAASGVSGAAAEEGAAAGSAGRGSTASRTASTGSAAGGSGGAHPGGLGGGGGARGGGARGGRRYVRPTTLGAEGFEDEEEPMADSGVTGRAAQAPAGDRHWQRMRRRWLDAARTTSDQEHPEGAPARPAPPNPPRPARTARETT
ncbi:hypothetical protein [Peterkaempfera sp. SMS 1(5)a]|uniref:WXG100-like domain-containing protein n=1 Tax=Peterkaempfera podocarpi TaxID=3232308 RepID=UPI003672C693